MCRFIAYYGHDILLEDVIIKPSNSLLQQSLKAQETTVPTNGDGFGVSWYAPKIDDEPGLFTCIQPAWNDLNLVNICKKIISPCFFAHVRSANQGGISQYNCHPFCYQRFSFMHNGEVPNFPDIKRHIRRLLDDDIYKWLKGDTDSEHVFALFLQHAKHCTEKMYSHTYAKLLAQTIHHVMALIKEYGNTKETCYLNLCISDGNCIVVSRYSNKKKEARTLYYTYGGHYRIVEGMYHLTECGKRKCVMVASEKLTRQQIDWHPVKSNHILIVDEAFKIHSKAIGKP